MKKRTKEEGFKLMPLPERNDLRPGMRDISPKDGKGRDVLRFADGTRKIHNIGGERDTEVATSPSRATYTVGLRKSPAEMQADPNPLTMHTGISAEGARRTRRATRDE